MGRGRVGPPSPPEGGVNYRKRAEKALKSFLGGSSSNPLALSEMMLAFDFYLGQVELTGAEGKIKATRKYEHPIEFRPSHTLWMFGNQMPRVHVINDPIWQRIKVIRFTVSIPQVLPQGELLPQRKGVDTRILGEPPRFAEAARHR